MWNKPEPYLCEEDLSYSCQFLKTCFIKYEVYANFYFKHMCKV